MKSILKDQTSQNQMIQIIFDTEFKDNEFIELMKKVIEETIESNSFYKDVVEKKDFQIDELNNIHDLEKVPFIPASFFKESKNLYEKLLKIPQESPNFKFWTVSSCTSSDSSIVGRSSDDLEFLIQMALKCYDDFIFLQEWKDCICFNFGPNDRFLRLLVRRYTKLKPARLYTSYLNKIAATQTKVHYLVKFFPLKALRAIISARSCIGGFGINSNFVIKKINKNLKKPEEKRKKIAIGGSTQLLNNFINNYMKKRNISYNLRNDCIVGTGGGGWDGVKAQIKFDPIDKAQFISDVCETLGTGADRIRDNYGFTETPILFGGHWSKQYEDFIMHCPSYARIIVRSLDTLEPVKEGEIGFLEVLTPFGVSASVNHAIIIDDVVQLISKKKCPECCYPGATFRVLGRLKNQKGIGCSSFIKWI